MRHVVVFAHPRSGSFIRQAAGACVDELERCGHTAERIDTGIARVRRTVRDHF